MSDMRRKNIPQALKDYEPLIKRHVDEFGKRTRLIKSLAVKGYLDAPYIPAMISLGPENGRYVITDDTTAVEDKSYFTLDRLTGRYSLKSFNVGDSVYSEDGSVYEIKSGAGYVYKINAPGWIYKRRIGGDAWSSSGRSGILVSNKPSNLYQTGGSSESRMLYMSGTEDSENNGTDHANNMFPIYPGKNTYAYFSRKKDSDSAIKEVYFVPSVMSVCYNIRPEDYAVPVGVDSNNEDTDLTGSVMPGSDLCKQMFSSDCTEWVSNFKVIFGYNVLDEKVCKPKLSTEELNFVVESKIRWLNELGVSLTKYKTISPTSNIEISYGEYSTLM